MADFHVIEAQRRHFFLGNLVHLPQAVTHREPRAFHRRHLVGVNLDQILQPDRIEGVLHVELLEKLVFVLILHQQAHGGRHLYELIQAGADAVGKTGVDIGIAYAFLKMQGRLPLRPFYAEIQQQMKLLLRYLMHVGVEQPHHETRRQVAEIHGHPGVHAPHVIVPDTLRVSAHRARHQPRRPPSGVVL